LAFAIRGLVVRDASILLGAAEVQFMWLP